MESVNQVKEALSARSRTATLDELRSEGRKRVRLIKAEQVAGMITEAVHAALRHSGMISQEEVDRLIERSRTEFREILQKREEEARHALAVEELLAEREAEVASLRQRLAHAQRELSSARVELEELQARGSDGPEPAPTAVAASPELLLSLMQELAGLKASLQHKEAQPQPQPVAAAPDFGAAIDKLAGTLNERLEQLGRKLGGSTSNAVEVPDSVNLEGLFRDHGKSLESNMDNIEVKQKAGGGIAANLARLKKLKGGG